MRSSITFDTLSWRRGEVSLLSQIEFFFASGLCLQLGELCTNLDGEDGVRPGAGGVHKSGAHCPVLHSVAHQTLELSSIIHNNLAQVFHIDSQHWVLLNLQPSPKL